MAIVRQFRRSPPVSIPPKATLRLRLLRDGDVTAGKKLVRVYRDWATTDKVEMVFRADLGEWSAPFTVDLATLLAQGEWLFCGVDEQPPRRTAARYMSFEESGDYLFDITSGSGGGPSGNPAALHARVRVDGVEAARELVALEQQTDGEWRVAGHIRTANGDLDLRVLGQSVYVMALDDYGIQFQPQLAVTVGQRIRPSTYTGWLYQITEAGTLPDDEPTWWAAEGDNAARLLGTARAIAVRYYRPLAHGPIPVELS